LIGIKDALDTFIVLNWDVDAVVGSWLWLQCRIVLL